MHAVIRTPLMLIFLALGTAGGCSHESACAGEAPPPPAAKPAPARTYDYTHKAVAPGRLKTGHRWTVAILRFGDTKEVQGVPFGDRVATDQSGNGQVNVNVKVNGNEAPPVPGQAPPLFNQRARELLKKELVDSKAFTVVERERILEILREINFGKTKFVDPATSPREGELMGVHYIIEGSLGLNEDKTLKGELDNERTYRDVQEYHPGLCDNLFRPARVNRQKVRVALQELQERRLKNRARMEFNIACYLSVYEVQTGQVVATVLGIGSNGLEAIQDAVEELIDQLAEQDTGVRVAYAAGDKVYLDVGANGGICAGQRFQVLHLGNAIRNREGITIGREETEVGEVEVTDVRDLYSAARILQKAGKIERGDKAVAAKH